MKNPKVSDFLKITLPDGWHGADFDYSGLDPQDIPENAEQWPSQYVAYPLGWDPDLVSFTVMLRRLRYEKSELERVLSLFEEPEFFPEMVRLTTRYPIFHSLYTDPEDPENKEDTEEGDAEFKVLGGEFGIYNGYQGVLIDTVIREEDGDFLQCGLHQIIRYSKTEKEGFDVIEMHLLGMLREEMQEEFNEAFSFLLDGAIAFNPGWQFD